MHGRFKPTAMTFKPKRRNSVFKKRKTDFSKYMNFPTDHIFFLQRTIGNQAVQSLLKSGIIQPKLKIGQSGDKYEQEADRVAEQVMRMPELQVQRQPLEEEEIRAKPISEQITPLVQRQVEEEEEEILQTKGRTGQPPKVAADIESRVYSLRSGGQPLPECVRIFFEPRFGHDFNYVRIHSNPEAAKMARVLNAQAFTMGRDIIFGEGQYAPVTITGKKRLAHELAHTLQHQTTASIYSANSQQNPAIMRAEFPEESEVSIKPLRLFTNIPSPVVMRKESWIFATVYFGKDHFLLLEDNYKLVERLSEELRFIPGATVVVDGHASTEGNPKYNEELSKKRKLAVIAILRSKLKTDSRIKFSGEAYGEKSTAVEEDKQESKRALNRRVEITIRIPSPVFERKKPIDLSLPIKPPTPEEELEQSLKIMNELDKKGELEPYRQKISGEEILDRILDKINVPAKYRGIVKKGVRKAGEKALDAFLDSTDLNKNEKKMIKKISEGLYKYQFEF